MNRMPIFICHSIQVPRMQHFHIAKESYCKHIITIILCCFMKSFQFRSIKIRSYNINNQPVWCCLSKTIPDNMAISFIGNSNDIIKAMAEYVLIKYPESNGKIALPLSSKRFVIDWKLFSYWIHQLYHYRYNFSIDFIFYLHKQMPQNSLRHSRNTYSTHSANKIIILF